MKLPTFESYGRYSSKNYGVNTLMMSIGSIRLYYSYKTIVAYYAPDSKLVVSENVWGPTTGKHLNWISRDKKIRLDRAEFVERLQSMLEKYVS